MGLRQAQLPGKTRIVDGALGGRPGAAVVAGDQHHLGTGLGNAGGDGTHAGLGDQLHIDPGIPVGVFQVVDQLGQILNGIDIVVRRRRDQADAGGRAPGLGYPGVDLAAGQMAPLSGLGPLGHFDLDLLGGAQVGAGHAEPGRGHLLDGAVFVRAEPGRILAALAGIGLAPQAVHGLGHAAVGLHGNGAIGHGTGLEPLDDLLRRLYLLQRNASVLGIVEFQQAPEGVGLPLVIHQVGILPEAVIGAGLHRLPKSDDGLGVIQMVLGGSAGAELMGAHAVQGGVHPQVQRIEGMVMPPLDPLGDLLQANARHRADGIGKVAVDDLFADAHRLKNLGGLVGLQGGNAHLGGDLHNARQNGLVVVRNGLVAVLVQHIPLHQLLNAVLGQVGIDGPGTVAQQGGEMVDIPGLRAFQDDGHGGPLLGPDQILLNGGHRQQRGNGHMVFVHPPVGEDDHVGPVPVGPVHLHKELVDGALQGGIGVVQQAHRSYPEPRALHGLDLHQLHRGDDGILDLQHPAVFRLFLKEVAVGADIHGGIRDNFLPQGIDGRVGHLGKELLEVVEKGLVLLGQHRQRDIRAHGGDLLGPQLSHGHNGIHNVLVGVAEGLVELVPLDLAVAFHLLIGHRQLLQSH